MRSEEDIIPPDCRCPACFSLRINHLSDHRHKCQLCGFTSPDPAPFRHWRHHAFPALPSGEQHIAPNPNNLWRRLGIAHYPTGQTSLSADAVIASFERKGVPVVKQRTKGLFGLPIPLGRWGEKLLTQIAPAAAAPDLRGKLTIGGICQTHEADAVAGHIRDYQHLCRHFVFVVDTASEEDRRTFERQIVDAAQVTDKHIDLQILHHALDSDFGRQRNRVQAAARTDWVLQLDCDEKLDKTLQQTLGWAITRADNMNLLTMSFPRKNLVDGQLSAHYPDIQHRLNHRSVRFHKPVHEAPNVPWPQVGMCWLGHIEHFLPRERLEERSRKYEQMEKGAGKPANLALLLTPFDLPTLDKAD